MKINYLDKISLLLSTGMPGLQKLIFFFFIKLYFGIEILGVFSNDYYLIQLIMIFTSLGLSGLLLVKIPKLKENESRILFSNTIYTYFIIAIFAYFIVFLLYKFTFIYKLNSSFLLLFTIGLNLLIRHYYLALKKYKKVIFLDLLVILSFFLIINIWEEPLLILALSYILINIVYLLKEKLITSTKLLETKDIFNSFNISFVNFLSGGIYLVFIPIVNIKLGLAYSAFFGFIFIIVSIISLIPMSLSIYYLPILSKNINNKFLLLNIYKKFSKYNYISLFLLFLFSLIIYFLLSQLLMPELFIIDDSLILYLLLILAMLSSKFSLPISNIFLSYEKTNYMTKINILIVIFYLFSFLFLSLFTITNLNFIKVFLFVITTGNILRILLLHRISRKEELL